MADPYIGEIKIFPYTFAPEGWFECNGQILSISQYQALFAVIGNQYGGSFPSTFAIPNLAGLAPAGAGQGPGLSAYTPGVAVGAESVALNNTTEIPSHNHSLTAKTGNFTTGGQGILLAQPVSGAELTLSYTRASDTAHYAIVKGFSDSANATLAPQTLGQSGSNPVTAHENRQPFLAFRFCICWDGLYPAPD